MDQSLNVGEVIKGTLGKISENLQAVLIFIGVLTVLASALQFGFTDLASDFIDEPSTLETVQSTIGFGSGIAGIAIFIITVIAQYLLWQSMLVNAGYDSAGKRQRYIAFFFLALLTALGVGFGFILLIIPGLIFSARWAAAPAFLITQDRGIIESMGDSWDAVRGNTTPVVLAVFIGFVAIVAMVLLFGGMTMSDEFTPPTLIQIVVEQAVSHLGTALSAALGVFLYTHLSGDTQQVQDVFA